MGINHTENFIYL